MRHFYARFVVLVSIVMLPVISYAQLTVVPGVTAAVMANKLAGPGVLVLNPVLTCATNA